MAEGGFQFITIAKAEVKLVIDASQMEPDRHNYIAAGIKLAIPGARVVESYGQPGMYEVTIMLNLDPGTWEYQVDVVKNKINTIAESAAPI
jgi:hypothetical protein